MPFRVLTRGTLGYIIVDSKGYIRKELQMIPRRKKLNTERLVVYIPEWQKRELDRIAGRLQTSLSEMVTEALMPYLGRLMKSVPDEKGSD